MPVHLCDAEVYKCALFILNRARIEGSSIHPHNAQIGESEHIMLPDKPHYKSLAKERIITALLSLMETYPFEEITVLQITQRADVARRTYYMHYKTKYDVLADYYDVLAREYYSSFESPVISDSRRQAEMFFEFWFTKRSYLLLLHKQNLLPTLMGRLHEHLCKMIAEDNNTETRYYTAFYAGGLWAVMLAWVESDFTETPSNLADIAVSFDHRRIFDQIPII